MERPVRCEQVEGREGISRWPTEPPRATEPFPNRAPNGSSGVPLALRRGDGVPRAVTGALLPAPAALDHYGWQQHCRGVFEIPVAA